MYFAGCPKSRIIARYSRLLDFFHIITDQIYSKAFETVIPSANIAVTRDLAPEWILFQATICRSKAVERQT